VSRLRSSDRLLVRLPSWLGDFVSAEPTIDALHRALEGGRLAGLSLAGPGRFLELLDGRFEDATRLADDESWAGHDVALFLDGSLRSVRRARSAGIGLRWSWFSGGRAWLAMGGFTPARERGATPLGLGRTGRAGRRLPRPFGAACRELTGLMGVAVIDRQPRLVPTTAGSELAERRLAAFGLAPGEPFDVLDASARPDSAKGAPASLLTRVVEGLRPGPARPLLVLAAPGEERIAREVVAAGSGAGLAVHLVDDPAPTLAELLALLARSQTFLGSDSGPRHLAAAVARPRVVLFGPTDPRHTMEFVRDEHEIRRFNACGPCHEERCPLTGEGAGACLAELDVDSIVRAMGTAAGGQ